VQPQSPPVANIVLEDQFGIGVVNLTNLGKLGVPVSKAHVPNSPSGDLVRPFEHLTWYELLEAQPTRAVRVTNQFGNDQFLSVKDGRFLLVPAIKDGQGSITLGQHWKCYDTIALSDPNVIVNLVDQFHAEPNVVVGSARYLCNPAQKTVLPNPSEPPPPLPDEHLTCYTIDDPPLGQAHTVNDQFDPHPNPLIVENPELLCLPSEKINLPEPGVLLSLGSGLMLLGWLDRRRRRSASGC
jgi:hypothetical protein